MDALPESPLLAPPSSYWPPKKGLHQDHSHLHQMVEMATDLMEEEMEEV